MPPGELADLADPSWLLECRLSGGEQVMAGDRPAYRINVARGDAERPASLMFPAAVAVVDAELGILLRLTSYLGGKPVRRGELTDISAAAGDFSVDLPPGLPVSEESGPSGQSGSSQPASIALQAASILARQAATETAKAAGHPAPRRPGLTAPRPGVSPGARRGSGADTGRVRQVLCPVLVGRDEEARHLQAALAAAQAGRGGTVLLTGEAGIGKSRLVRETVRAAGERGVTVLAGRAVAAGVPTPFRPFAEALAPAGRAGRLPDGADLDEFRPALGRLIPQWRPPQIAGDESLVFLGEAVLQLLRALGPDAGCLLILEDLHWADRETLALLEYLADNLSAEPVLCVGTLRAEQGAAARLAGGAGGAWLRGRGAAEPA